MRTHPRCSLPSLSLVAVALSLAACDPEPDRAVDAPRRVAFETAHEVVTTAQVAPGLVGVTIANARDGALLHEDCVAEHEVAHVASDVAMEWTQVAAVATYDAYREELGFRAADCASVELGQGCTYDACEHPDGGASWCIACDDDGLETVTCGTY